MGEEYDNIGYFPQIRGNFLDEESSPFLIYSLPTNPSEISTSVPTIQHVGEILTPFVSALKGPFKNDVTAQMTISTPPSLPCHHENNRICNLKQWKSPFLLTSFPPFPGEVPLVVPARLTTERAY